MQEYNLQKRKIKMYFKELFVRENYIYIYIKSNYFVKFGAIDENCICKPRLANVAERFWRML